MVIGAVIVVVSAGVSPAVSKLVFTAIGHLPRASSICEQIELSDAASDI
jgi:hypothetical protein